jgi:hypothetical protein
MEVRGDSKLVINQMNGVYEVEVRKPDLLPYHTAASELARTFEYFNIEHVRAKKTEHKGRRPSQSRGFSVFIRRGESMTVTVYEKRILPITQDL